MNIAVAQSGGPTSVINSSLLGVIRKAADSAGIDRVYGSRNGIEGIINNNFVDLTDFLRKPNNEVLLKQTPSSFLGSCRYKLPDVSYDSAVYELIAQNLLKNDIKAFFYIGGNDSMDTVAKLSKYMEESGIDIKIMGVPKTIDNDLFFTDHTPGFGSAAKFVTTVLSEIVCDSAVYDIDSVTIVEIMGRNAGWLTASTCVLHLSNAAPHLIYLPERKFDVEKCISDIKSSLKKHRSVIIALSEGIELSKQEAGGNDGFGHVQLGGVSDELSSIIKKRVGCKVRNVELNVLQRCCAHLASRTDVEEAIAIGSAAVEAMLNGQTGKMMCFKRVSDNPYKVEIESVDACLVANGEKKFPDEWINEEGNNVADAAIPYFLPLISGECKTITDNGIPLHIALD